MSNDTIAIADDKVVTFHYKLRDQEGSFTESSEGASPVVYMHGRNSIVPGLETQMAGKKSGDKFTATVSPYLITRSRTSIRVVLTKAPWSRRGSRGTG